MGLFDNLFLDKNTPMAINTGEKPAIDVASGSSGSNSSTGGAGASGTGATGDSSGASTGTQSNTASTPASGGFLQMMESTATQTPSAPPSNTSPSPSTDISQASSVSSQTSPSEIPPSFDIGGFDLGETSATPSTDSTIQVVSSVPSQSASEVSFIVTADSSSEPTPTIPTESKPSSISIISESPQDSLEKKEESSSLLGITMDTPTSSEKVSILGTLPQEEVPVNTVDAVQDAPILTESPLTTLMSGFSAPSETTDSSSTNPTNDMSPSHPSDASVTLVDEQAPAIDSLFSLTDTPSVTDTPVVSSPVDVDTTESHTISSLPSLSEESVSSPSTEGDHPMSQVGKELARMTRSPRLQGKLTGFITELEELSQEEERLKDEKRKQIESYQLRIEELKKEYETRIHALELEEADLKKQISVMDEERQHITQVIEGFKQELEVV